jgi:signal transduction histidine kinase
MAIRFNRVALSPEEQRRRDFEQRLRLAQLGERLRTLSLIQAELIRVGDPDELCRLAVELARARLGMSRVSIWLVDANTPTQLRGTYGTDEQGNTRDERDRQVGLAAEYRSPLSADLSQDANFLLNLDVTLVDDRERPVGQGWVAAARMVSGEGVIGWLFVDNLLSQAAYTEDDGDIIKLYASSIGALVQNKHMEMGLLQQQAAQQALQERLRALNEVSIALTRAEGFDALTEQAVELGQSRLGFDRLSLWFMEADGIHAMGSFGTDEVGKTRDERAIRLQIKPGDLAYQAREQGLRVMVSHAANLMDEHRHSIGTGWNAAALLWDGDRILGWIAADNLFSQRPFTLGDQEVLTLYGMTVGHLCTRKRTEEQLQRQRAEEQQFQQRLHALTEVNLKLLKLDTVDELCQKAVELGRARLGIDRMALFFVEDDRIHARGSFGTDEAGNTRDERDVRIAMREDHLSRIATEHSSMVEVWERELVNHQGQVVGHGWNAAAMLWDGEKAIGWIAADNLLMQRPFSQGDRDILTLYGTTLGHLFQRKAAQKAALGIAVEKERAELMTEMMSNLSHDLRTPLSVINTSLYLLERLHDPTTQQEKLGVIKGQTARLEKLIQDILTLSRLEQQPVYTLQPVPLTPMLSELATLYQPVVERKEQSLHLQAEAGTLTVMGLEEELRRILSNLLDNAINYTPVGGSITLRARQEGLFVIVEVSDTGIGIKPEDLPRIFDRFYRADSARSSTSGGAGLGLSIVKRLVQVLSADISAESTPGKGTTFRLTLLAASRKASHPTRPGDTPPPQAPAGTR